MFRNKYKGFPLIKHIEIRKKDQTLNNTNLKKKNL